MTTDTNKLIRHLTERIEYCKLKDNRTSRALYEELLKDFEQGKFETDARDYPKDILEAKKYGFCADCVVYSGWKNPNIKLCGECFDSGTKINFKPKEAKQDG
jgi:hypothetical protein